MKKNKLTKICFLSVTFLFLFLININVRASVLEKINVKNDLVRVVVSAENENLPLEIQILKQILLIGFNGY